LTNGLLLYLVVTYFHLYGLLEDNKQYNTIQYNKQLSYTYLQSLFYNIVCARDSSWLLVLHAIIYKQKLGMRQFIGKSGHAKFVYVVQIVNEVTDNIIYT
jgi:hypothetical protein